MSNSIQIIKHEADPNCGSFEVCFADDRPSSYSIGITLRLGGLKRRQIV